MAQEQSQDYVWSFYQNEANSVFEGSHARLEYIVRRARRLAVVPKPSLLNIGIGDGHLEKAARKLGWSVCSIDPSDQTAAAMRDLGVVAKAGRIDAMEFADGQFDFVTASEVIEHLSATERAAGLAEIKRVLKPGAYLIGTVPYRENLEDNRAVCPRCHHVFHRWGHAMSFDIGTLRGELAAQFGDIRCRRMAFVDFPRRSALGKLKGLARLFLARCGVSIAVPSIFFVARKS